MNNEVVWSTRSQRFARCAGAAIRVRSGGRGAAAMPGQERLGFLLALEDVGRDAPRG